MNTGKWLFAQANILHVFFREIYVQWSSNQIKTLFKALRSLLRGICYSPGEHWNLVVRPGEYTSCIFSSNKRLMKLKPRQKRFSRPKEPFLSLLKKSQKRFRRKEALHWLKKLFKGNLVTPRRSLESGYSPDEYTSCTFFEGNQLFARRTMESGCSPRRIYFMYFLEKYTSRDAQTKLKTLFKA